MLRSNISEITLIQHFSTSCNTRFKFGIKEIGYDYNGYLVIEKVGLKKKHEEN